MNMTTIERKIEARTILLNAFVSFVDCSTSGSGDWNNTFTRFVIFSISSITFVLVLLNIQLSMFAAASGPSEPSSGFSLPLFSAAHENKISSCTKAKYNVIAIDEFSRISTSWQFQSHSQLFLTMLAYRKTRTSVSYNHTHLILVWRNCIFKDIRYLFHNISNRPWPSDFLSSCTTSLFMTASQTALSDDNETTILYKKKKKLSARTHKLKKSKGRKSNLQMG